MIIKLRVHEWATKYYKHTSGGKPMLGGRGDAASFEKKMCEKVLEHLRVIDHRFQSAELVNE